MKSGIQMAREASDKILPHPAYCDQCGLPLDAKLPHSHSKPTPMSPSGTSGQNFQSTPFKVNGK